jgi:hypothetical protein
MTRRTAIATFKRLARDEQHQGEDPAVLRTRSGEIAVYPAAWPLAPPAAYAQ